MVVSILLLILIIGKVSTKSHCNIPKECEIIRLKESITKSIYVKCLLTEGTRLRFNISSEIIDCKQFNMTNGDDNRIIIRPKYELSKILEKGMIDLSDIIEFSKPVIQFYLKFEFHFFKGFDLNLFDEKSVNFENYLKRNKMISFKYCKLDFFHLNRKLTTCQDFIDSNSTDPKSIFQMISKISTYSLAISFGDSTFRLCPLVFKNFSILDLVFNGENTFYSKKLLTFSNDSFKELNSTITELFINIVNVELSPDFLHRDVFKEVKLIKVQLKLKKIHPNLFIELRKVSDFRLDIENLKSLMHDSGIEWIKNMNKEVYCNLSNSNELHDKYSKIKYIYTGCLKDPSKMALEDVFPDEDFCLYKDFPINQLVTIIEYCNSEYEVDLEKKITCTYLWITRSYKYLIRYVRPATWPRINIIKLLESNDERRERISNGKHKINAYLEYFFKSLSKIASYFIFDHLSLSYSV